MDRAIGEGQGHDEMGQHDARRRADQPELGDERDHGDTHRGMGEEQRREDRELQPGREFRRMALRVIGGHEIDDGDDHRRHRRDADADREGARPARIEQRIAIPAQAQSLRRELDIAGVAERRADDDQDRRRQRDQQQDTGPGREFGVCRHRAHSRVPISRRSMAFSRSSDRKLMASRQIDHAAALFRLKVYMTSW